MNYIEYMSGGGAAGTDTTTVIQLPIHIETKEMEHFVTKKPTYPSYFIYPNFVKFFKYGFGQNKNPYAKSSIASSDGVKSNNNAEVSSNSNISKLNID